jgi:hypothetical protein
MRLAERPGHRATTAVAQAIYPFVAEGGLSARGVYLGRDLHGGSFVFDPFVLYERRLCTNPNMLVIGGVGSGKSASSRATSSASHCSAGASGLPIQRASTARSPKRSAPACWRWRPEAACGSTPSRQDSRTSRGWSSFGRSR